MKNGNLSLLVTTDKGSWFHQEDSWPESFAELKNPVSAGGKKILNIPSNASREPGQILFLDLFCLTVIFIAKYRSPVNWSQILVCKDYNVCSIVLIIFKTANHHIVH